MQLKIAIKFAMQVEIANVKSHATWCLTVPCNIVPTQKGNYKIQFKFNGEKHIKNPCPNIEDGEGCSDCLIDKGAFAKTCSRKNGFLIIDFESSTPLDSQSPILNDAREIVIKLLLYPQDFCYGLGNLDLTLSLLSWVRIPDLNVKRRVIRLLQLRV